jgi:hypothetical protein
MNKDSVTVGFNSFLYISVLHYENIIVFFVYVEGKNNITQRYQQ